MPNSGPLKWHGGKCYLAARIVAMMPRHLHFCEPYAGGLAVLLERDPNDESLWLPPHKGVSEVANDLNGQLMNFWSVLRCNLLFPAFLRRSEATAMSRQTYAACQKTVETLAGIPADEFEAAVAQASGDERVKAAWAFFVAARQSRAGTFRGFTQLTRNRLRRGINGNASEWLGAVDGLAAVHARLQPVVLENMTALDLIRREDGPGTLFYCDPPYCHSTRKTTKAYEFEMSDVEHVKLLTILSGIKGRFILSGYRCKLYDAAAEKHSWRREDFEIANHAAGGSSKRRMTESVWMNY